MSAYSSRLFRILEYRSRLNRLAVSGPAHASYLSGHPNERDARLGCLDELESEIASADIEGYDREALLHELDSYRKAFHGKAKDGDGLPSSFMPTLRDIVVAAFSAYAAMKGRDWLEQKIEELNAKQAAYAVEEFNRGK